uniref:DUF2188 domain-containing protein n=1 Tax=candidate division WOR-3 bacterium TaxID=2052148 RepID=A0A7C4CBI3_UNCW3
MPERKVVHVVPHGDQWAVRSEGSERAASVHSTQAEAIGAARTIAVNAGLGQVVVHRPDGRIREEHTYGRDPFPPKG